MRKTPTLMSAPCCTVSVLVRKDRMRWQSMCFPHGVRVKTTRARACAIQGQLYLDMRHRPWVFGRRTVVARSGKNRQVPRACRLLTCLRPDMFSPPHTGIPAARGARVCAFHTDRLPYLHVPYHYAPWELERHIETRTRNRTGPARTIKRKFYSQKRTCSIPESPPHIGTQFKQTRISPFC